MSGFLYVLIGVLLMMLVLSFFARFFWLFILIYLVIVAVKIIKGIFFRLLKEYFLQTTQKTLNIIKLLMITIHTTQIIIKIIQVITLQIARVI